MVGDIIEEDGVIYRVIEEDSDGTQKLEWLFMKDECTNFTTSMDSPGSLIDLKTKKELSL